MTFATIDSNETNTIKPGNVKTFVTTVLARINIFRDERKVLKKLYSHHTANDAKLAQAQRDVNSVWF